ncbi:MAG: hypothetical protein R3C18_17435 [Planctomycetaceae bacterium]
MAPGPRRGRATEKLRLAEVELRLEHPWTAENAPRPPVSPQRIYISCDGILYGTNEVESHAAPAGNEPAKMAANALSAASSGKMNTSVGTTSDLGPGRRLSFVWHVALHPGLSLRIPSGTGENLPQ